MHLIVTIANSRSVQLTKIENIYTIPSCQPTVLIS